MEVEKMWDTHGKVQGIALLSSALRCLFYPPSCDADGRSQFSDIICKYAVRILTWPFTKGQLVEIRSHLTPNDTCFCLVKEPMNTYIRPVSWKNQCSSSGLGKAPDAPRRTWPQSTKIYSGLFRTGNILDLLRKIFGPIDIDNIWRIRNNMEIDKLIEGADMVRFIKAQRIKWLGHIQRMEQARPARKLLDWKPMGTRPVEVQDNDGKKWNMGGGTVSYGKKAES